MSSPSVPCVFDGFCNLCRDGDISLLFDDGTSLVAHSFILVKASPVLKQALEECNHDGTIPLPDVERDTWIEILAELYPTKGFLISKVLTGVIDSLPRKVARECSKYDIQPVLDVLDTVIAHLISMHESIGMNSDAVNDLKGLVSVAATAGLNKSKEQAAKFILTSLGEHQHSYENIELLFETANFATSGSNPAVCELLVKTLLAGGDHQWNTTFLCSLLKQLSQFDCTNFAELLVQDLE